MERLEVQTNGQKDVVLGIRYAQIMPEDIGDSNLSAFGISSLRVSNSD